MPSLPATAVISGTLISNVSEVLALEGRRVQVGFAREAKISANLHVAGLRDSSAVGCVPGPASRSRTALTPAAGRDSSLADD